MVIKFLIESANNIGAFFIFPNPETKPVK